MSYEYPGGAEVLKTLELVNLPSLEEIALRLSRINRFAGEGKFAYSVLSHSLTVGWLAISAGAPPAIALAAFLHDAAEALVGDVRYPWKNDVFTEQEERIKRAIFRQFRAEDILPECVKRLDEKAGLAEIAVLGIDMFGEELGQIPIVPEMITRMWIGIEADEQIRRFVSDVKRLQALRGVVNADS